MDAPRPQVLKELIRLCKRLEKSPKKYKDELKALRTPDTAEAPSS